MKTIILPLTKNPDPAGRYGPVHWQNWFRGCEKAVQLEREIGKVGEVSILVLSSFQLVGRPSEADIYAQTLSECGANNIDVIHRGNETVGQIEFVVGFLKPDDRLIIISSLEHFPRVWWLVHGKNIEHRIVWGIPRPREVITDFLLSFIFPIIDLFGLRKWYQRKIGNRRDSGVF